MKLLLTDVDGTILNGNTSIHDDNFKAMKQFQENGHKIVICTGRTYFEMKPSLDTYHIPYDALILNNGGQIIIDDKTIYEKTIPHHIGKKIIQTGLSINNMNIYICDGISNYIIKNHIVYDHGVYPDRKTDFTIDDINHHKDYQILCASMNDESIEDILLFQEWILENYGDSVTTHLNDIFLDIVPKDCSKGQGLSMIKEYYKDIDMIYAIGDSYNDISMIQESDIGATFTYAPKEVQKEADIIVDYVYELIGEIK